MRIEPADVQQVKLRRRLLGYHRRDVDGLLESVTASYGEVWLQWDGLLDEAARLREELEQSRERERLVGDALVRAQRIAETTVAEAKSAAEALVREAGEKAEQLTREARAEPERVREEVHRLQALESEVRTRLRDFLAAAEGLLEGPADEEAPLGRLELRDESVVNGAQSGSAPLG